MLVVDIGANKGLFSKFILKNSPDAHVIAIEPNPIYVEFLDSIHKEYTSRFQFLTCAIGAKNGIVDFFYNYDRNGQLSSTLRLNRNKIPSHLNSTISEESISVQMITPLGLIKNINTNYIDFLKIDTQGTDIEILNLFLSDFEIASLAVEVFGSDLEEEHLYHNSKNTIRELFRILEKHKHYFVQKIIPAESKNYEFNVFIGNSDIENSKNILHELMIDKSPTFSRFWRILGMGETDDKLSNKALLKKIILGLKHPRQSFKRFMRRIIA